MYKSVTKRAFTLAEVLITLGVIGVVAAISMPTLMKYLSTRELDTARTTMSAKLVEAMKQMQVKEELTGYNTSEEFAEAFKKYMKVTNVCDSTKLKDCFGYSTLSDDSGHSIDVSKMATASKILPSGFDSTKYPSTTVGIQFVNGVTGVMTYKKDCEWQNPMEASGGSTVGMKCLTLVYDVNGAKKPNKLNKDIVLINAKLPSLCTQFAEGVCGTFYEELTPVDCTNKSGEDYKKYCDSLSIYSEDYWAGAVKTCGGIEKMLTEADVAKIASVLYGEDKCSGTYCDGEYNEEKAKELGFSEYGFSTWTRTLGISDNALYGEFSLSGSFVCYFERNYNLGVICKE